MQQHLHHCHAYYNCFFLFCDVTQLQAWKGNTPSNIVQRVADHDGSVIIQRGTLTGLEKFTLYTVAVVAYNGAGDSPRSDTKIIKTEEGGMWLL